MTEDENELMDVAPGQPHSNIMSESLSYIIGLALALLLTAISFWVASTSILWGPGVAVGLVVLAIAQMGVHLVFFLHITSGPDNTRLRSPHRLPGDDRHHLDHGSSGREHGPDPRDDEPANAALTARAASTQSRS
jgi:heme/copper-type cytochrome/quinol oxidase subunit 4